MLFSSANLNRRISVMEMNIPVTAIIPAFNPSTFQIILYVMYQLGMTLGIFSIMRRREKDPLEDFG